MQSLWRKNCLILPFIERLLQKVQSIHCLDCIFDAKNKKFFRRNDFLAEFMFDSSSEHHCAQFAGEKTAWFGLFSKSFSTQNYSLYTVSICIFEARNNFFRRTDFFDQSFIVRFLDQQSIIVHLFSKRPKKLLDLAFFRKVAPKSTVYTLSRLHFWGKNVFFEGMTFLAEFCSILHQSTIVHSLGQKKLLYLAIFSKSCCKKCSLYTVSICIFDGLITAIFEGNDFWITLMHDSLSRAPLCTGWAEKTAWFGLFSKGCSKYLQSIHCLVLAFLRPKNCFFEVGTFLVILMLRFFIRPSMCTVWAEKNTWFGLFSKSCSKRYSLYTVSTCIFEGRNWFFRRNDFLVILMLRILYQSTVVHSLGLKKSVWFLPFFEKWPQKIQSIHCLVLHFWGQNTAISKERLFWSHLFFDSFIRAPLCTVCGEKTAWFGLFSKGCSKKYSLYTVSICIFVGQKLAIFEGNDCLVTLMPDSLSRAPLCTGWAEKIVWFGLFSKGCSKKYSPYTISILHFWGQKSVFSKGRLFWSYLCFDSLSDHQCAQFGQKKILDLAFFRNVAPKSTVYTLFRFAFFEARELIFPKNDFFGHTYSSIL